ncbi:indolethylamine N-methyltransferase-like [Spea bombifrons]|uniref:indolethylamine N-methyltransferase-like n=1 Tax=Spea bombifrons TaxID=233779 RepID=UPI00234B9A39|nr:indolethylamine N-methyltransferase-like [Spea bombifrons]
MLSEQAVRMEPSALKHYHMEEFNPKLFHGSFFSPSSDETILEELFRFPIKKLHQILKSGEIKGDTLIDFSAGPVIFQLLSVCEYFKEITVLEFNDKCIQDLQKWIKKEKDAYDWSHASKIVTELEGKSDKWKQKEEALRSRIKQILKCDFTKQNPTDPVVLPKADCAISLYMMNFVCKDLDSYRDYLKKVSSMLKVGGHLLIFGGFDARFYTVGNHKFHKLSFDEKFLRKALGETGFSIKHFDAIESQVRNEFVYYGHVWFVSALKTREI